MNTKHTLPKPVLTMSRFAKASIAVTAISGAIQVDAKHRIYQEAYSSHYSNIDGQEKTRVSTYKSDGTEKGTECKTTEYAGAYKDQPAEVQKQVQNAQAGFGRGPLLSRYRGNLMLEDGFDSSLFGGSNLLDDFDRSFAFRRPRRNSRLALKDVDFGGETDTKKPEASLDRPFSRTAMPVDSLQNDVRKTFRRMNAMPIGFDPLFPRMPSLFEHLRAAADVDADEFVRDHFWQEVAGRSASELGGGYDADSEGEVQAKTQKVLKTPGVKIEELKEEEPLVKLGTESAEKPMTVGDKDINFWGHPCWEEVNNKGEIESVCVKAEKEVPVEGTPNVKQGSVTPSKANAVTFDNADEKKAEEPMPMAEIEEVEEPKAKVEEVEEGAEEGHFEERTQDTKAEDVDSEASTRAGSARSEGSRGSM
jgi:hypothetical protein